MLPDFLVAAIESGRLFEWIVILVILEGLFPGINSSAVSLQARA